MTFAPHQRTSLFLLTLFLSLMVGSSPTPLAGESEMTRLSAEYPAALERMERGYSRVSASGLLSHIRVSSPPSIGSRVQIKVLDGMHKATITSRDIASSSGRPTPTFEYVYCVTPEVSFEAGRDLKKMDDYILSNISQGTSHGQKGDEEVMKGFSEMAGKYVFAPFKMNGWPMVDYLDRDSYKITSAEEEVIDGERVLRFRYSSRPGGPVPLPISGQVELLPDRAWVMRHHELNGNARPAGHPNDPGIAYQIILDVEYRDDRAGLPVPARVRYSGTFGESVLEFDKVELGVATPVREFTPSYYGLPDPTAPVRDPSRSYLVYWLFGLAALALAAAVVLKRKYS